MPLVRFLNLLINFKLQKYEPMTDHISVSLLQPALVWEGIDANLEKLDKMMEEVPQGTALVLLPETFSTGFTMRAEQAVRPESPFSATVQPVCGQEECAAVVESEGISLTARVIGLIGAAFPDGAPEPSLAFREP
ncbi:MAG: hypothetical protein ACWGNV_02715 [Bacteroidales bacterium]